MWVAARVMVEVVGGDGRRLRQQIRFHRFLCEQQRQPAARAHPRQRKRSQPARVQASHRIEG
jgi:hypothetical protein